MDAPGSTAITLQAGCQHDVPEIVQLAETVLPRMTYLTDPSAWKMAYRFGVGRHIRDQCFFVAREARASRLLGFVWADAAMYDDHGFEDPWWCIDAVAVDPAAQRHGVGAHLVEMVVKQAKAAGIVSLYGICYPDATPFWRSLGFQVSAAGGSLASDRPARRQALPPRRAVINDAEGDHVIVLNLPDVADAHSARLQVRED